MAKILVVEDEESILIGLRDNLEMEDYEVEVARDGEEALLKLAEFSTDLVLLDLMIPKKSGLEVCRVIQKKHSGVYVIMLTAKNDESSKISGLEMGADDYVTKPFSILELLARIRSALRRLEGAKPLVVPVGVTEVSELRFGDFFFDFKRFVAQKSGADLELNPKEFQILHYFYQHRGEVVLREDLLEQVWGYQADNMPTTRTIDNHIVRLRQKLEDNPSKPERILSVRGVGYKLNV
jgi:DNA-binding response OmpR family regulator